MYVDVKITKLPNAKSCKHLRFRVHFMTLRELFGFGMYLRQLTASYLEKLPTHPQHECLVSYSRSCDYEDYSLLGWNDALSLPPASLWFLVSIVCVALRSSLRHCII
jgi:hypothetical protein